MKIFLKSVLLLLAMHIMLAISPAAFGATFHLIDPETGKRVPRVAAVEGHVYQIMSGQGGDGWTGSLWGYYRLSPSGEEEFEDRYSPQKDGYGPLSFVGSMWRGAKHADINTHDSIVYGLPALFGNEVGDADDYNLARTKAQREYELETPLRDQVEASPVFGKDRPVSVYRVAGLIGQSLFYIFLFVSGYLIAASAAAGARALMQQEMAAIRLIGGMAIAVLGGPARWITAMTALLIGSVRGAEEIWIAYQSGENASRQIAAGQDALWNTVPWLIALWVALKILSGLFVFTVVATEIAKTKDFWVVVCLGVFVVCILTLCFIVHPLLGVAAIALLIGCILVRTI